MRTFAFLWRTTPHKLSCNLIVATYKLFSIIKACNNSLRRVLVYSSSYKKSLKWNCNVFPKAEKIINTAPNLLHVSDKYWASLICSVSALKITFRSRERNTLHFHCFDSPNLLCKYTYGGNVCFWAWNPPNHDDSVCPLYPPGLAHCWHTCNTRDHLWSPGCQRGTKPGT